MRTSSTSIISSVRRSRPNSNFVSEIIIPRVRAYSTGNEEVAVDYILVVLVVNGFE